MTCSFCGEVCYSRMTMTFHMIKHLQPSAFECPICQKTVVKPLKLKFHLQTHVPKNDKILKCDECDQSFSYPSSLRTHKECHHVPCDKRKLHTCSICEKEYPLKIKLADHMRTCHSSSNSKVLCSECGKTFQYKSEMKRHLLVSHNKTGKHNVQCKHCGIICKNQYNLTAHEKRHTGIRFSCLQCPYSSHLKQQLVQHTRVKHTDLKPFDCTLCGKTFRLRSVLKHHMVQHTGEAKYNCPFCSRTFMSSGNYYSHRKRMHPEEYKKEKNRINNERFKLLELQPDFKNIKFKEKPN